MTEPTKMSRYHGLFVRLGEAKARQLVDQLQILALTRPDTLREIEKFIDRTQSLETSHEDRGADDASASQPAEPASRRDAD